MEKEVALSFNEKCDKILNYLADISRSDNQIQVMIHINKLSTDTGINSNDPVINFLQYQKKFIDMNIKTAYLQISSSGLEFISNNSFCQIQANLETNNSLNWYNQQDAKQRFDDYPIVRRQKRNAYIFAAIGILLTLLPTMIAIAEYIKCK